MRKLLLAPSPLEVAVARVPADMAVQAEGRKVLAPMDWLTYVATPGDGLPWGAVYATWQRAGGMIRYRSTADRPVWATAARYLGPCTPGQPWHENPKVVFIVHEQVTRHGKTVFQAVRVRREEEQ